MTVKLYQQVSRQEGNQCQLTLTLDNGSGQTFYDWKLQFIAHRHLFINSSPQGELEQIGSQCRFSPYDGTPLASGSRRTITLILRSEPIQFTASGLGEACLLVDGHYFPLQTIPLILPKQRIEQPEVKQTELPDVATTQFPIIPRPHSLVPTGGYFRPSEALCITTESQLGRSATTWLKQELASKCHYQLQSGTDGNLLLLDNSELAPGAYQLEISRAKITLEACDQAGFIHGSASLLQLMPDTEGATCPLLPCCQIQDQPRFAYRGMMLDSVRHFWPVEQVKQLVNQLAYYKFNTLHWHLTDDEGWRLEIKAFPALTEAGAWRGPGQIQEAQYSHLDRDYGGYYTQSQVREIVQYAKSRAITIIPEIDIPGHSRAAIKALPELLLDPDDNSDYLSIQNYSDNVLNPALPGTYHFLDRVLEEVATLFPSPWIHIGGDEVPEGVWQGSPACQQLMNRQGYSSAQELQGHLLRYAEQKLQSLGRRMLGWEEAAAGNKISKRTVLYPWINEESALRCAKQGYDLVLQPGQYTYLDIVQSNKPQEPGADWAGTLPLDKLYHFEPLAELADDNPLHKRVLGLQCAIWCEHIATRERLDYMLYPRLLAAAELAWSDRHSRHWLEFLCRLKGHFPHLDRLGICYRDPWQPEKNLR
jgi:hexosaminidase